RPTADSVLCVAFSPDGRMLVGGAKDRKCAMGPVLMNTIMLWELATGQLRATLAVGYDHVVAEGAFHPDGRMVASAGMDHTTKLWDVMSGREQATLNAHTDCVECVAFSPDGTLLASASRDKTVKLWDVATGKERATLRGYADWVVSVAFRPDGSLLASGALDK